MKRVKAVVAGRVQGVSYRASCQKEASRLKLSGWVRNLPDGRVEFQAQGPGADVDSLLAWAGKGPFLAKVINVEVQELAPVEAEKGFAVLR